jgi:hypothetical protein
MEVENLLQDRTACAHEDCKALGGLRTSGNIVDNAAE